MMRSSCGYCSSRSALPYPPPATYFRQTSHSLSRISTTLVEGRSRRMTGAAGRAGSTTPGDRKTGAFRRVHVQESLPLR